MVHLRIKDQEVLARLLCVSCQTHIVIYVKVDLKYHIPGSHRYVCTSRLDVLHAMTITRCRSTQVYYVIYQEHSSVYVKPEN
ncbi:hypothetical protein FKM82_029662 [Ascaphus truei]